MQNSLCGMSHYAPVVAGVAALSATALVCQGCSSQPSDSLMNMLPADLEVERWHLVDTSAARTVTQLYNQIDGGASKYIDRGWKGSAYATYIKEPLSVQVAVHDMGEPENAQSIYNFDLPVSRVAIEGYPDAVVNMGLPAAYQGIAFVGRYYIEVSTDDRSDGALNSIKLFVVRILERGGVHR
jgi:hypothetical protein